MSEERKKSGAEKAIDRAELRARAKLEVAIKGWAAYRSAQIALDAATPSHATTIAALLADEIGSAS